MKQLNFRLRFANDLRSLLCSVVAVGSLLFIAPAHAGWLDWLLGGDEEETVSSEAPEDGASSNVGAIARALTSTDVASGLKQALQVGTERVVAQLGAVDGFNADPKIRIPLPGALVQAKSMMDRVGLGGPLEELETQLNRAAEAATPEAKALFVDAISQMTFDDAMAIYRGDDTAATAFLRGKMSDPLREKMGPIIDESLRQVGAAQLLDTALEKYRSIPFAPELQLDLTDHVARQATTGIFDYLAVEEAAIRADPAKRSTDLLKRVFSQ